MRAMKGLSLDNDVTKRTREIIGERSFSRLIELMLREFNNDVAIQDKYIEYLDILKLPHLTGAQLKLLGIKPKFNNGADPDNEYQPL